MARAASRISLNLDSSAASDMPRIIAAGHHTPDVGIQQSVRFAFFATFAVKDLRTQSVLKNSQYPARGLVSVDHLLSYPPLNRFPQLAQSALEEVIGTLD